MIIDAHVHLWETQKGRVNSQPVYSLKNGKSMFGGQVRQMIPPYMTDGKNTSDRLLANMDYAGVSGAVITQEEIDGNQDSYLLSVKKDFPERFKICSLYEEDKPFALDGFDGIKLCSGRFKDDDLTKYYSVFKKAEEHNKFISIDLAEGERQTGSLFEIIRQLPKLKIAIGHFGMVTKDDWLSQIRLAQNQNVFIESGGITWLYNSEFYPYKSAIKAIIEASQICGFNKLMWGSDYPRTMAEITYKMSFDFILKSNELTEEQKELFLYKNAERFYGFDDLPVCKKVLNMLED